MVRALSTTCCALAEPRALLSRWRELAGERVEHIAVDQRLPPALQVELLLRCQEARLPCLELTHSRLGLPGRRAASPISQDREELRSAARQISDTLRTAGDAGAARVLLLGERLPLSTPPATLARRFARGLDIGMGELAEERGPLAAAASQRLSLVLDEVLPLCEQLSLRLLLAAPAPWPDQVPGPAELGPLLERFRGAPLGTCFGTDWAALASTLAGVEIPAAADTPGLAELRLADASGLRSRLAPGTGEIPFARVLAGAAGLDQVVAVGPEVWPGELARALELLDGLGQPAS